MSMPVHSNLEVDRWICIRLNMNCIPLNCMSVSLYMAFFNSNGLEVYHGKEWMSALYGKRVRPE